MSAHPRASVTCPAVAPKVAELVALPRKLDPDEIDVGVAYLAGEIPQGHTVRAIYAGQASQHGTDRIR